MRSTSRASAVRLLTDAYGEVSSEIARTLVRRGYSLEQGEDVAADAFATVLAMDDETLASIENLRAYVHGVARNLAAKVAAQSSSEESTPDDALDRPHADPGFTGIDLATSHAMAKQSFESLSEEQRTILWLAVVERRSMREIASALDKSVSSVTTQLSRARVALRDAYVAGFLAATSRTCDYDARKLARVVTGTATARTRRAYAEHAATCDECPRLENAARDELHWGTALVAVVAAGGVTAGMLEAPQAYARPLKHPVRATLAGLGLVAATVLVMSAAPALLDSNGRTTHLVEANPADLTQTTLALTATPSRMVVAMPPPGGEERWTAAVTNAGTAPAHLFVAVTGADLLADAQDAHLVLALEWEGARLTEQSLMSMRGDLIYVGELDPGVTGDVLGISHRDAADTDQTATASVLTRFVATAEIPDGLEPGDTAWTDDLELPATGPPPMLALWIVASALIVFGAVLRHVTHASRVVRSADNPASPRG